MNDYYKRRFNILIVAYLILVGGWGWLTYRHVKWTAGDIRKCAEKEQLEETERVMEWKSAYIECEEEIRHYVNQSRYMVCLDDMVKFTEESFQDHEREMYLQDELQTCEDSLARLRRETEVCRTAETLKVKDGTH
jgi:hypothetical protein